MTAFDTCQRRYDNMLPPEPSMYDEEEEEEMREFAEELALERRIERGW